MTRMWVTSDPVRSPRLTRRSFLGAAAAAVLAGPALHLARERGYDRDRRRTYAGLVEGLIAAGALPDGAPGRLADVYADALPRRRREIGGVLDALADARLAQRAPAERVALLREWAAAGGARRALAARAVDLAAGSYGPGDRALPVVI